MSATKQIDVDKVKKGLECCLTIGTCLCDECPYESNCTCNPKDIKDGLLADAIRLIDNFQNEQDETINMEEKGAKVVKHPAPHDYPFNEGYCPVCLCQLDTGDLFCRQCGSKLIWD